jgi:rSAM/selenodomain-associated transferase 2
MSPQHVRDALQALVPGSTGASVAIGPAADGGYWLLGARRDVGDRLSSLFEGIEWGSSHVCAQTRAAAHRVGLRVHLLSTLPDVDRPEDLRVLRDALEEERGSLEPASLSVVIPALDEEGLVALAVDSAFKAGAHEVIVADGGSRDGTWREAEGAGARVIESPRGRARQMNRGADECAGDAVLFLHADCRLPPQSVPSALDALARGAVAGAFTFGIDSRERWLRGVASLGRTRHRMTGHPYGDQGLFLAVRTFRELGGFPDMPVMEDWEMVRRLRRLGAVQILPAVLPSSARSWLEHGLLTPTLVNGAVIGGYRLGVDVNRLADLRRFIASRV